VPARAKMDFHPTPPGASWATAQAHTTSTSALNKTVSVALFVGICDQNAVREGRNGRGGIRMPRESNPVTLGLSVITDEVKVDETDS